MKLKEVAKQAVQTGNSQQLGECVDVLRFKFGMNYHDSHAWINKQALITLLDFESMMYEADCA